MSFLLDPQKSETPEPIDIKLDRRDYVGDLTPHANFGISNLKGGGSWVANITQIKSNMAAGGHLENMDMTL